MTKKVTKTMKILIVMAGFHFSGMAIVSMLRCCCSGNGVETTQQFMGQNGSAKQQSLENFGKARSPVSEAYVISLHESTFNVFEQRNFFEMDFEMDVDDDKIEIKQTSLEWFEAYNGMKQSVLDEWSRITGLKKLNATEYQSLSNDQIKSRYDSPHVVGCYLSHWRLLEKVRNSWRKNSNRSNKQQEQEQEQQQQQQTTQKQQKGKRKPDMLFVFEDDSICVSNLIDRTWSVVQKLPDDWDILYIGGKPMSYYTNGTTLAELHSRWNSTFEDIPRPSNPELLEAMCKGDFGKSYTGPYVPGTTQDDSIETTSGANLAEDPPYWKTKYILNTNSYVINPKRIQRVLRVLSQPMDYYLPIDVKLSYEFNREFMNIASYQNNFSSSAPLNAYMTPHMYCDQGVHRRVFKRDQPPHWEGYYNLPWQSFKHFPEAKAYVWGKIANRKSCPEFLNTTIQQTASS